MSDAPDKSQQLRRVLEQCRQRLQEGKLLNDAAVVNQFPDLMPELAAELKKLRLVHNARLLAGKTDASPPVAGEAPTTAHAVPRMPPDQPPLPVATPREPVKVRYFGDYELLEELGRGGMGVVYKARQVSLNRLVAVKMLLSGAMAGEEEVKRFYSEAEAAGHLEHPHIVPIYEVGEHQGTHYFSMAYVRGRSLHELLRDGPLPAKKAAEYLAKVADAIAYAHDHGVLHRDLKPHNILIDEHDQPRVTDFGLAKRLGGSEMTATGQVLGTPSYMPPEQALAARERIGPRSDVYSLGATLYACITGRPPYQAEKAAYVIMMVIGQEPVAPRTLIPQLDRDVETIALKAMEKSTERRYQSATALREELQRFLTGHPIVARPIGLIGRCGRWRRRNPIIATLGGMLASLVIAIAIAGPIAAARQAQLRSAAEALVDEKGRLIDEKQNLIGQLTTEQTATVKQRDLAEKRRKDADTQRKEAERRLLEAQRNSLNLHLNLASSLRTIEPMRAERLLDDPERCPVELRDLSWSILRDACRSSVFEARGFSFRVRDLAFRPNSDEIAIADERQVRFFNTTGKKPDRVAEGRSTIAFSPDGEWFVTVVNETDAAIFRTSTLEKAAQWRLTSKANGLGAIRLRWLSSGRILVSNHNSVWIDVPGTERRLSVHTKSRSEAIVHGGKRFAFPTLAREVLVGDDDVTPAKLRSQRFDRDIHAIAMSTDGRMVAVAQGVWQDHPDDDRQLQLWNLDTNEVTHFAHTTDLQGSTITQLCFSADGRKLYAGSVTSLVTVWDVESRRNVCQLPLGIDQLGNLCVSSRDGSFAVANVTGNKFGVWRIPPAEISRREFAIGESRLTANHATRELIGLDLGHRPALRSMDELTNVRFLEPGGATAVECSANGSRISVSYNDGKLRLFDSQGTLLKEAGEIPNSNTKSQDGNEIQHVSLTGDGRFLAAGRKSDPIIHLLGPEGVVGKFERTGASLRIFACSPTRAWLAVPEDGRTTVFDIERNLVVCQLPNVDEFEIGACWSADGNLLVTASQGGTLTATDFVGDEPRQRFRVPGHKSVVQFLDVSPDGRLIVSGDIEGNLRFTDAATGAERLSIPRAQGGLLDGCFVDNGRDLVTVGLDRRLNRWRSPTTTIVKQFSIWDRASVREDRLAIVKDINGCEVGDPAAKLRVLTYLSAQNPNSARVFDLVRNVQAKRQADVAWHLCHYPDHKMPQAYEAACIGSGIFHNQGSAAFLRYWESILKADGFDANGIKQVASQHQLDLRAIVDSYKQDVIQSKLNAQLYVARGELSPPIVVVVERSTGRRFVIKKSVLETITSAELESVIDGMLDLDATSPHEVTNLPPANTRANSVGFAMILVPAGKFHRLGEGSSKVGSQPIDRGRGLLVSATEITRAHFDAVMKDTPDFSPAAGDVDSPAVNLCWYQAVDFCNRLSRKEGLPEYYAGSREQITIRGGDGYRLLDADEWDYAASAGNEVAVVAQGDKRSAFTWHKDNSEKKAHRVAENQPNAFGLYDTYGNVWEWCWPAGHIRGDSVQGELSGMIARGLTKEPEYRATDVGFRVARNLAFGPADRTPLPSPASPTENTVDDAAWIDVLATVDPEEHTIGGAWMKSGDAIAAAFPNHTSVLELPVNVRGGYEFAWEFTRISGDQDVNLIFPIGWRSCNLLLSGDHGKASGLDHVDFRGFADNSTSIKPGTLENGRRYRMRLRVELEHEFARVSVFQDGKQIIDWAGLSHRLGAPLSWSGSRPGRLLFAVMSDVTVHSAKLKQLGTEVSEVVRYLEDLGEYRLSDLRGNVGGGLLWGVHAPQANQILIGLRIRHDDRVRRITPVYRDAEGKETDGTSLIGRPTSAKSTDVIARPGYAIGGIEVRAGNELDAMRVIFMKLENGKLAPTDRYRSPWLGGAGGGPVPPALSDGRPVVGLYGGTGGALTSLGLVFAAQPSTP